MAEATGTAAMTDDAAGFYDLRDKSGALLLLRDGYLCRGSPKSPAERLAAFIPKSGGYCLVYRPCADQSALISFNSDHMPNPVQSFNARSNGEGLFTLDIPASGYRLAEQPDGRLGAAGLETEAVRWQAEPTLRLATPWLDGMLDRIFPMSATEAVTDLLSLRQSGSAPLIAALLRLLSDDIFVDLEPAIEASGFASDLFEAIRLTTTRYQPVPYNRTRLILSPGIAQYGWDVGEHSYGAPIVMEAEHGGKLKIGRYCQIASDVVCILANHRMAGATAYPFSSLQPWWPSCIEAGGRQTQHNHTAGDITIGSDVWIGLGVTIMPGAIIGDGAVLGSRAVVSGQVPPYAVVVGSPKRVLRRRFDDATVERLLRMRWWDWQDHVVNQYAQLLMDQDISKFLTAAEADETLPAHIQPSRRDTGRSREPKLAG